MKKILIVDDNIENIELIKRYGEFKNYFIKGVTNPLEVEGIIDNEVFDIVILDIMMEQMDGFTLAQKIKNNNIIFLSAKQETKFRIEGLKLGAIDYMTKPFSLEELFLKIENILKLKDLNQNFETLKENYIFNIKDKTVKKGEAFIKVSPLMFDLFYELIINKNIVLSRSYLLDKIWGTDEEFSSRTVDVHIVKLRQLLKEDGKNIKTIRGKGYTYEA